MRILYIGHTYTVQANLGKIAVIAKYPGVELLLVTPDGWKGPLYKNASTQFETPPGTTARHVILPTYLVGRESAYFFSSRLFSLVADFQPDIVHVEEGTYALSYAQTILALKKYAPNSHASFFTWWNLPQTLTGFRRQIEEFNLGHSAAAIVGNNDAKEILRCKYFSRAITVLPQLGVDAIEHERKQDAGFRTKLGLDRLTIGYVGRIEEEKGVLDLVEAVGKMSNKSAAEILMVGAGSALTAAEILARKNDVKLVVRPAVRNEEVPEYLAQLDMLVLPSRTTPDWKEQFGHILIEAMAAGVPVVGSASGQIPYVIADAGRIVPEGDPEALSRALDGLVRDPKLRASLAEKGKARVKSEFTNEIIGNQHVAVFERMLASGATIAELSGRSATTKLQAVSSAG